MRLFVAVDTPSDLRRELARIRDELRRSRADARWEADAKLHCTLKFLGEVAEPLAGPIGEALASVAARHNPFEVRYASIGCFPDRRRPRVVWAGIEDPAGALAAIAGDIDGASALFGIQREDRPLHPHVTLGRIRSLVSSDDLLSRIESITFEGPTVKISEFLLVRSTLKPSGSVYDTVRRFPLGAP